MRACASSVSVAHLLVWGFIFPRHLLRAIILAIFRRLRHHFLLLLIGHWFGAVAAAAGHYHGIFKKIGCFFFLQRNIYEITMQCPLFRASIINIIIRDDHSALRLAFWFFLIFCVQKTFGITRPSSSSAGRCSGLTVRTIIHHNWRFNGQQFFSSWTKSSLSIVTANHHFARNSPP